MTLTVSGALWTVELGVSMPWRERQVVVGRTGANEGDRRVVPEIYITNSVRWQTKYNARRNIN